MRSSPMPSSAIRSFAYDPQKRDLWITFTSGRRYVYADVPQEIFHAFGKAESRGSFFNMNIRDVYPYGEITGRREAVRR